MPITRMQLVNALSNWCVQFCFEGCPEGQRHDALTQFCNSSLVPQEDDVDGGAAAYFASHHYSAYYSLKGRLEALNFRTNTTNPVDKAHNHTQCAACAAHRGHHVEEVHGLLRDLSTWQSTYRGEKAVLNTLKVIRALSRA